MKNLSLLATKILYTLVPMISLLMNEAVASEITNSAIEAIKANQRLADKTAESLVAHDYNQAFLEVTKKISQTDLAHERYVGMLNAQQKLLDDFSNFAALDSNKLEKSRSELENLKAQYIEMVRLRFDLSWVPTDVGDQYRLIGPLLRQTVTKFEARCSAGRSDISYRTDIPQEPMPPNYHFDLMANFNGEYPTVSYAGLNYVRKHDTRQDLMRASGMTAATSASILLSSGTGAAMTAASYAFPAASVVLLTASAVQHFANLSEANKIAAEVAEAEALKFSQTKRDDYVAQKYREFCVKNLDGLKKVATIISTLERNDVESENLVSFEANRVGEMQQLQRRINEIAGARCRLLIAENAGDGKCVDAKADLASRQHAQCQINSLRQVDLGQPNPECSVQLDQYGNYANQASDRELADSLSEEKVRSLVHHKLVVALGNNRVAFLDNVSHSGWKVIDDAKERAFVKFVQFSALARRLSDAGLIKSETIIANEITSASSFEKLRGRFIGLTSLAIRVTFGQASRDEFADKLVAYRTDLNAFFRKHRSLVVVQALHNSMQDLERIMNVAH